MKRLHKIFCLCSFFILCISCARQNERIVTPVEAIHLAESVLDMERPRQSHTATSVKTSVFDGNSAYIVTGESGDERFRAVVDARTARGMEIYKNGSLFYRWKGPLVAAHRGTVKFAPENTLPAFAAAIERGADLIEMDIRETRDKVLVIMHDATVDRTTNGKGRVDQLTLAEIKKLDAGSWFSTDFRGVQVPTFQEALDAIRGKALPDLDFKAGSADKFIEVLKEEGLLGKVTLYCGDWDMIKEVNRLAPDGFYLRPTVPVGRVGLPTILAELDPQIVNINWQELSEGLVRDVHLSGRKSFLNTMDEDTELVMQLALDTAPDYIQSDHIDILMPMLQARGWHK